MLRTYLYSDLFACANSWGLGRVVFVIAMAISITASIVAPLFISHPPVGGPNSDLEKHMYALYERGVLPWTSRVEPGYAFYMAFKLTLAQALELSYASVRYLDSVLWAFQAYLIFLLSRLLLALASPSSAALVALSYAMNPLGLVVTAIDNRITLSSVFLFSGLSLVIRAVTQERFRRTCLILGGACFAVGAMVRSDQAFILLVIAPAVAAVATGKKGFRVGMARACRDLALAGIGFLILFVPWRALLGTQGGAAVLTRSPALMHWDGLAKYREEAIGRDAASLIESGQLSYSWQEVVDFQSQQAAQRPLSWLLFWLKNIGGTWFVSETRKWDLWNLGVALPYLVLGFSGLLRIVRRRRFLRLYWFPLSLLAYVWFGSAFFSGLGRYMVPAYWALCLFAVQGLATFLHTGRGGLDPRQQP